MIPSFSEVYRSLQGAWRIFMWDASGLEKLDFSADGFWKSFAGPVALAPAYYFLLLQVQKMSLEIDTSTTDLPDGTIDMPVPNFALEMISYFIGIALFPLVMVFFTKLLKLTDRFVPLIVTYNWTTSLLLAAMIVVSFFYAMGIFSLAAFSSLLLVLMLVLPFYLFAAVRFSTGAPIAVAIGLVVIDILLGQLIMIIQSFI